MFSFPTVSTANNGQIIQIGHYANYLPIYALFSYSWLSIFSYDVFSYLRRWVCVSYFFVNSFELGPFLERYDDENMMISHGGASYAGFYDELILR